MDATHWPLHAASDQWACELSELELYMTGEGAAVKPYGVTSAAVPAVGRGTSGRTSVDRIPGTVRGFRKAVK
eukprot:5987515-Prymnesium_polylepis.1